MTLLHVWLLSGAYLLGVLAGNRDNAPGFAVWRIYSVMIIGGVFLLCTILLFGRGLIND